MDSTWFSSASKLRDSFASRMPTTIIPPPITQSVYLASSRQSPASARDLSGNPQPWYSRKQRSLEADLQLLLDAQAEALIAGQRPSDDTSASGALSSSSRSTTPTLYSVQDFPRERQGKIRLKDARKGLYMTMRRLALLKREETSDADDRTEAVLAAYDRVKAWTERRNRLLKGTHSVKESSDSEIAAHLRSQADALQPEIDDLEGQLVMLQNEQRTLRKEAEDMDSRVQAKLSSYTRNLDMLDKDVKDFLKTMKPADASSTLFSRDASEDQPFWALPPNRRTLGMASEVLEQEKQACQKRLAQIETEREALEEGAVVWKDAVTDIEAFERILKAEMKKLSAPQADESPESQLQTLLTEMAGVEQQLESKLKLADSRGWKLLIAALGAELDAFQKGRSVLEGLAGMTRVDEQQTGLDERDPTKSTGSVIRSPGLADDPGDDEDEGCKIRDLDDAFHYRASREDTDTSDDDGPDPGLLISPHEHDE